MDDIRFKINNYLRFREGDVYHTIFPTRAFKKLICYRKDNPRKYYSIEAVATLIIPPDSTIVRAYRSSGKLRTDQVYVKYIENKYGEPISDDYVCQSPMHGKTIYKVDSLVKPKKELDRDVDKVCRSGIHFFLSKKEAVDYSI
uniref:Uncharacterized protein n=1 Tax=Moumouvirus sp. 'Monve' TaxID=1128131 RepID=H2EFK6_9VIRU|nr:hypothetical protein mv_L1069 [Moumouvirus Monve]